MITVRPLGGSLSRPARFQAAHICVPLELERNAAPARHCRRGGFGPSRHRRHADESGVSSGWVQVSDPEHGSDVVTMTGYVRLVVLPLIPVMGVRSPLGRTRVAVECQRPHDASPRLDHVPDRPEPLTQGLSYWSGSSSSYSTSLSVSRSICPARSSEMSLYEPGNGSSSSLWVSMK